MLWYVYLGLAASFGRSARIGLVVVSLAPLPFVCRFKLMLESCWSSWNIRKINDL